MAGRAGALTAARRLVLICYVATLSACTEATAPGNDARADPLSAEHVALGGKLYAEHCAVCHGANLEGQPDWRSRLPNGKLPAPPHDESGHTWHHTDEVLFAITKYGMNWPNAPKDYQSDMPVFGETLSDQEIWAVLAFIKSHWQSTDVLAARQEMMRNLRRE
jgi:mono/diheme cytochrome c family protein